ncbi:MAG TPA: glycosyltransferase [Pseudomonadota bacterium]|nr:glycosyltransferase [Pseudomonadota bacterium]
MPRPLLSAALIVRNEERFLESCLRSLLGRVDEIVVVDTGSNDRSPEIAQSLGARLVRRAWSDDFAAARNVSVEAARGEWILYIDADEEVVHFDRAALELDLADPRVACYTVRLRPREGYTRYREHRLFRNRPDLRFQGVIHESLLPALSALREREGLGEGASAVTLEHYGYADPKAKAERDLPLLRKRLRSEPGHVYSWAHLGSTLAAQGDLAGAEAAWRRGAAVVRERRSRTAGDSLPHLHLARHLLDQQRDATALLEEARRWFPDNHALTWLAARRLFGLRRFEEAMPLFAQLAATDAALLDEGELAYDASIFGANAHAALGLCAFHLRRYAESAAHYARAEAIAPNDAGFRAKRMFAAAKALSG